MTFLRTWRDSLGAWLYRVLPSLEARLYGFRKQNINADGIVHTAWVGGQKSKPLLVLIHGFSADKTVWPRFARHFNQDFQIVIPDLAGHGETGFSPEWRYHIDAQAKRMLALMRSFNASNAHFVGNSMGGFIAAHLARFHPQHVASATLVDPAGVKTPQASEFEICCKNGRNPFFVDTRAEFYQLYAMTMAKPPYLPRIVLNSIAKHYQQRKAELRQIFPQFQHVDGKLDAHVEHINVPTLILWGTKDALIHHSGIDVWKKINNSEVETWSDLGHMPMFEAPKRCAQRVRVFLDAL